MSDVGKTELVPAAMAQPAATTLPRRHPSVRRTSHIDMLLGDLHDGWSVVLDGGARDLLTGEDSVEVIAAAAVRAAVRTDGTLESLTIDPHTGDPGQLLGLPVGGGFRDAVHVAFPDEVAAATPLLLLLDDLPVAALISGYARLYRGDIPATTAAQTMKSDICSGWRADGLMMTSVNAGTGVPVTIGPAAPPIATELATDRLGWHPIARLPVGAMRRRRLIDVGAGAAADTIEVHAMFRDTHVGPDAIETVLHEYALTATIDAASMTFTRCKAVPRVLPWVECPVAAGSADRLVGLGPDQVREFVRRQLRGVTTCTHLNDLLRSLGDVAHLASMLPAPS
jgi:hypothetical protein